MNQLALIGSGVAVAAVIIVVVAVIVVKRRSTVSAKPRSVPRGNGVKGDTFDAGVVYENTQKAGGRSPHVAHVDEDEVTFEI